MALPSVANVNPGDAILASEHNIIADNLNQLGEGYTYVTTVYFTSSGTFTKASYPYLRAIRVRAVGAGGGGGGAGTTGASQQAIGGSGGGGGYAESFITDIASLSSSETVTVGAGGSGGSAGNNSGAAGGNSSFGSLVTGDGGNEGSGSAAAAVGAQTAGTNGDGGSGTGDLVINGTRGGSPFSRQIVFFTSNNVYSMGGGGSALSAHIFSGQNAGTGQNGTSRGSTEYGAGGNGGINAPNQGTTRAGGNGAPGLIIVELFA